MKDEVEIPLQGGRIAHHDRYGGLLETDEFAGDRFLGAVGDQGIRSRQINQRVVRFLMPGDAFGQRDGFSRPVAGVLVHAGQLVEHGALADVRIAGQRDQNLGITELEAAAGFRAGRLNSKSHTYSSSCSTRMDRESLSRMAMTVPRIR